MGISMARRLRKPMEAAIALFKESVFQKSGAQAKAQALFEGRVC